MRLTDFENEDALDLLAKIIEPAAEIMNDQKVVAMVRSGKPVIFAVAEILRTHKKSAIEIVAALHGEEPGKVKFNVLTLASDVIDLMNDPEVQAVFMSQGQENESVSSGSATANTEDKNE